MDKAPSPASEHLECRQEENLAATLPVQLAVEQDGLVYGPGGA